MTSKISEDSIVVQKKDLPNTAVDGDLVIISYESNNYVGLNPVARKIWEEIEKPRKVEELCVDIVNSFKGDSIEIRNDVIAFLGQLADESLIDVSKG